jgi:hypothetical protein
MTYSGHNGISTHSGIIFCANFEVLAKHFSNFSSLNIEVKCMENTINEEKVETNQFFCSFYKELQKNSQKFAAADNF